MKKPTQNMTKLINKTLFLCQVKICLNNVKKLINSRSSFFPKICKMGANNFIFIFTNIAIKGKKEKIKQGRKDFSFYISPILTTVSDVYNASHHDNSASGPFR